MKIEMKGGAYGVEIASDGRVVDRKEILQRGLLVVGRKILAETEPRTLSAVEQRAVDVAKAAETRTESETPAEPEPPKAEEQPADVADPMIEIHRARQRMDELM